MGSFLVTFGLYVYTVGHMTTEDLAVQTAIIEQINAELGVQGISMTKFAKMLGRPYDSTRDYLKQERPMRLDFFLEAANALGIPADEIIRRARQRMQ